MKLSEYLGRENVLLVEETTKQAVLDKLAGVMAEATGVKCATMSKAIADREKLMSTGIGQGLAVPHVRLAEVKKACVAVAISAQGIADYASLDGAPVKIVVLIAAPAGQHDTYIRLLAQVVEILKQDELREAVVAAQTPKDVYEILTR